MKTMIKKIEEGEKLSSGEVRQCFETILKPETPEEEIEGFLKALAKYEIDADLLTEAARVLRRSATPVPLLVTPAVDTAGTGGDKSGSFNFSTAAALLVAACGVVVAKHGNRSITSKSGSADLLEVLGVPIDQGPEEVAASIKEKKFGFMMAPLYHPAARRVQQIRRRLGLVTVFNFLGPLLNPAGVQHQVIGVFENRMRPIMAEAIRRLGLEKTWVVWGEGGLDEISLCGKTFISEVTPKGIAEMVFEPEEVGFKRVSMEELRGGTAEENAKTLVKIFEGSLSGPLLESVLLNAAAALVVVERAEDIHSGVNIARRTLERGRALALLEKLRKK